MTAGKRYRSHGEGSITIRKGRPKPFMAQITVRGQRLSQSFVNKTDATRWIQDTNNKIGSVSNVDLLAASIEKALKVWLDYVKITKSPKTYLGYRRIADKYIIPQIGHRRVYEIKPLDLRDILTAYSKEVSQRELLYIWQTASSFFSYLVAQGVMPQNLARSVARPRKEQSSTDCRYLSRDQVRKLVEVAETTNHPLVDLYYFALSTGMREGEILGLRWNNVDWDAKCIIVVEQVQYTEEKRAEGKLPYTFQSTKTEGSKRRIPVGEETIRRLKVQQRRNSVFKQLAKEKWKENNLVFPSEVGTPMEPTNVIRRFKDLLKNAELPNIRFRDLRHTHATLLLLRGVHPKVVSERLGHADITTTLRIYSHVIPTMQEGAASTIEEILEKLPPQNKADLSVKELDTFEREI
ncbi:MAG: hypothetical protein CO094_00685 [Anaerolineae bacterium CG_4_9_14_3_um_filter_57_17]|nr:tyrosine-type recombinase/integrase [bacterium]NCT21193.1 tyrosine-type recombinase/integrase [bacterium]OIO84227.1 MAG: hypothetical protein AUK01_09995 [Anaerolineae bacterium CG2_30_57_67]PJB68571.1 MAG: hypothetical protein CO094_00685 [Anaerolineae bacterium CG_4_9_14_3_um_filter_57_17]